jgi:hypothetical protein
MVVASVKFFLSDGPLRRNQSLLLNKTWQSGTEPSIICREDKAPVMLSEPDHRVF